MVTNNFKRSVFLAPIDPKTFVETIANPDPGAANGFLAHDQCPIRGDHGRTSQRASDGRLQTEFRLWDVATRQADRPAANMSRIRAMRAASRTLSRMRSFSRISGEQGFFDAQIAFVDETGPPERRRKRLAIMDQDGANLRYMTAGRRSRRDAKVFALVARCDLYVVWRIRPESPFC